MNKETRQPLFRNRDTREMMEMCLNCKRAGCTGSCEKIERMIRDRARCARKDTRLYTLDGEAHPLSFWAQKFNVKPDTLRLRLRKNGGNLKAALEMKYGDHASCVMRYTAYGITRTLAEWAALCEKSKSTLQTRLNRGKSPEDAFWEARSLKNV